MTAAVLALPGLWAGLTIAVLCLAASVWLTPGKRPLQPAAEGARR